MKTTKELLDGFRASLTEKSDRIATILKTAADDGGRTLNTEEASESDGIEKEIKAFEDHIARLEKQAAREEAAAKSAEKIDQPGAEKPARGTQFVAKSKKFEESFKGQNLARMVIVNANAHMNRVSNEEVAKHFYGKDWVESMKEIHVAKSTWAGVAVGQNAFATNLVGPFQATDFVNQLYPKTVYGQLRNRMRPVRANYPIKGQDGTAVAAYVGEADAIGVSKPAFTSTTLTEKKVGVIVVYTKDLLRQADIGVEQLIVRDATEACAQKLDSVFVSASAASDSTPAGIRNGITELGLGSPLTALVNTADEVRHFVGMALKSYTAVNNGGGVVFAMSEGLRISLSLLRNALGQVEFPGLQTAASINGNYTLEGVEVITSNNVSDSLVIAIKPEDIWTLNYDTVEVSMADQATIVTAPGSPQETFNLFQQEMLGVRLVLPNNWDKRRTAGVIAWSDNFSF